MGDTAQNIEEINVVDEFLNEGEAQLKEALSGDNSLTGEVQEEVPSGETETEEAVEEEFTEEVSGGDEASIPEDTSGEYQEYSNDDTEGEEEFENLSKNEVRENNVIDMKETAIEDSTILESEDESIYEDEALEKLKHHYSEMSLLFDVLEREVMDHRKTIANQKLYINKIEKELIRSKKEAEETKKILTSTKNRLIKAEKKLDIVKRELLE